MIGGAPDPLGERNDRRGARDKNPDRRYVEPKRQRERERDEQQQTGKDHESSLQAIQTVDAGLHRSRSSQFQRSTVYIIATGGAGSSGLPAAASGQRIIRNASPAKTTTPAP